MTFDVKTIKVNNDSDFRGAGELPLCITAFNAWQMDLRTNQMSINSGHTVTLNKTKSIISPPWRPCCRP